MSSKLYDNPNELHIKIIERRFAPVDADARFRPYTYITVVDNVERFFPQVEIESVLPDEQIVSLLSTPETAEELTYLDEFNLDRTNLRTRYEETIARLQVIENDLAMTNQNAQQYIRDLAKNQRLIIRLLYKTKLSS